MQPDGSIQRHGRLGRVSGIWKSETFQIDNYSTDDSRYPFFELIELPGFIMGRDEEERCIFKRNGIKGCVWNNVDVLAGNGGLYGAIPSTEDSFNESRSIESPQISCKKCIEFHNNFL